MPQLPQDKANHLAYGALIACFLLLAGVEHADVLLIVAAVGAVKEAADWIANIRADAAVHGVEFMDFAATLAGGLLVALPGVIR